MSQYGVILNVSGKDKCRLHRRDDFVKQGLQSVGQNFCDKFVDNVAQIDWSKVMDSMGTKLFRDQGKVSVILFFQQNAI
jgi:hypothetical protein